MQSFIYGLLLACVSGLTVLAFKNHGGFVRLFPFLVAAATALFVGITVWHVAIEVTWTAMHEYLVHESLPAAASAKARLRPPYAWVALWYLAVLAFLWINLKLPPFLQDSNEHDATLDEEKSH